MSSGGAFERLPQLLHFAVPPDEAGQAARGARLKAGASRDAAGQFVDRGGVSSPFTGTAPSGFTSTCPSARLRVSPVTRAEPGLAICSIRAARWVVWPTAV